VIAAVSVAVERVTEIVKQMFPWLTQPPADPTKWNQRTTVLQLLALCTGIAIAAVGELQIGGKTGWAVYVLVGLLSAGASRFWNNILGIIKAMKINRQLDAELKLRTPGEVEKRVEALETSNKRLLAELQLSR
jgi:hypothetical protein